MGTSHVQYRYKSHELQNRSILYDEVQIFEFSNKEMNSPCNLCMILEQLQDIEKSNTNQCLFENDRPIASFIRPHK